MTTPHPREIRLDAVCADAGLRPAAPPRPIVSHSNDAWSIEDDRLGDVVLRVSWRGDVTRIGREVAVAARMPATIHYPEVVAHGITTAGGETVSYSVARRVAGRPLDECWPSLSAERRRAAVAQLATALRDLHRWTPDEQLVVLLLERPYQPRERVTGLLGGDLNPLPVPRVLELAGHAESLPHVDPALMRAAADLVGSLATVADPVDDPTAHGLMHGDLQLCNLLWDDALGLTVLDLEWVRFGPPLLDLQRLCERADVDVLSGVDTHPVVLRWLAADYPEGFADPHAMARLRLYTTAYAIRDVIVNPPDRDPADLPADHSVHRLRRLVDGTWPVAGALPDELTA